MKTLSERRKAKGLTQEQVAVLLKTCQSEVAKVEAGEKLPPKERRRAWARLYGVPIKTFKVECEAASWDALPLWKYVCNTPSEIETIECNSFRRVIYSTNGHGPTSQITVSPEFYRRAQ